MAEAANSIPPSEIIVTSEHRIACDGGGGALGHPKVFLEMGEGDFVECPYCDRRFVRAGSSEDPNA
ncbi:zinc-finger domain-containing protein [Maricaulis sp.]|uniref:zinc-finger domain-containing protein n=1 Tax=Maricaulis sp. TaxID=1486257 RepID=UPI0026282F27|nr:zinc-finger domain-containing protein [Maricaulis sp.]